MIVMISSANPRAEEATMKNRDNYENIAEAANPLPEDAGEQNWTCPMHPEVVRDEPGQCPECGMNLILKT